MEADADTHACLSYMCVSKRVTQTDRVTFPDAKCVPMPAGLLPPAEKKPAANKPAPAQAAPKSRPAR